MPRLLNYSILGLCFLGFIACDGGDNLSTPGGAPGAAGATGSAGSAGVAGSGGSSAPQPVSKNIGTDGGVIDGARGSQLSVPKGALTSDVSLTVAPAPQGSTTPPAGLASAGDVFVFTPHGTQFAVPVTIKIPADADASVVYVRENESDPTWSKVNGAERVGNTMVFQVTSFSLYGAFTEAVDDPVNPVDPLNPVDPVNPVDPLDPVEPTNPKCAAGERVLGGECIACAPGTTNPGGDDPTLGDTSCISVLCATDFHVSNHVCQPCAAGSTNVGGDSASGPDTSCDVVASPCAVNEYVSNKACKACGVGTTNAPGDDKDGADTTCDITRCATNQRVSSHVCVACPSGSTNVAGDAPSGADTSCDTATTGGGGGSGTVTCGTDQRASNGGCVACPPGTTNAWGDDSGTDSECDKVFCLANFYVSSNVCVDCAIGSTNAAGDDSSGSNTSCDITECAFNERVVNHACVPCPDGSTNAAGDEATSTSGTSCDVTICAENEYVKSNVCTPCAAGTTNAAGDEATSADTSCSSTLCDANYYVSSNTCTACPTGQTRPAGDDPAGSDTTCSVVASATVADGYIAGATVSLFDANDKVIAVGVSSDDGSVSITLTAAQAARVYRVECANGTDITTGETAGLVEFFIKDGDLSNIQCNAVTNLAALMTREVLAANTELDIDTARAQAEAALKQKLAPPGADLSEFDIRQFDPVGIVQDEDAPPEGVDFFSKITSFVESTGGVFKGAGVTDRQADQAMAKRIFEAQGLVRFTDEDELRLMFDHAMAFLDEDDQLPPDDRAIIVGGVARVNSVAEEVLDDTEGTPAERYKKAQAGVHAANMARRRTGTFKDNMDTFAAQFADDAFRREFAESQTLVGDLNPFTPTDASDPCGDGTRRCFGCDHRPFSGAVLDSCGVCRGNNSSCEGGRCQDACSLDQGGERDLAVKALYDDYERCTRTNCPECAFHMFDENGDLTENCASCSCFSKLETCIGAGVTNINADATTPSTSDCGLTMRCHLGCAVDNPVAQEPTFKCDLGLIVPGEYREIPIRQICDGPIDCVDETDELNKPELDPVPGQPPVNCVGDCFGACEAEAGNNKGLFGDMLQNCEVCGPQCSTGGLSVPACRACIEGETVCAAILADAISDNPSDGGIGAAIIDCQKKCITGNRVLDTCGDGFCDRGFAGENAHNCPVDCNQSQCAKGDQDCACRPLDPTDANSPEMCRCTGGYDPGTQKCVAGRCGDGKCDLVGGERAESCPGDCGNDECAPGSKHCTCGIAIPNSTATACKCDSGFSGDNQKCHPRGCGDGLCEEAEQGSCRPDCGGSECVESADCGCDPDGNNCQCKDGKVPGDGGSCVAAVCGDGKCDPGDCARDCRFSECTSESVPNCVKFQETDSVGTFEWFECSVGRGIADGSCQAPVCGDGFCDKGETNCLQDCTFDECKDGGDNCVCQFLVLQSETGLGDEVFKQSCRCAPNHRPAPGPDGHCLDASSEGNPCPHGQIPDGQGGCAKSVCADGFCNVGDGEDIVSCAADCSSPCTKGTGADADPHCLCVGTECHCLPHSKLDGNNRCAPTGPPGGCNSEADTTNCLDQGDGTFACRPGYGPGNNGVCELSCGNNFCEDFLGETLATCPADCKPECDERDPNCVATSRPRRCKAGFALTPKGCQQHACGDGHCLATEGETVVTCASDCARCGDGHCALSETCEGGVATELFICGADCGRCQDQEPVEEEEVFVSGVCGDGFCEVGVETPTLCAPDCSEPAGASREEGFPRWLAVDSPFTPDEEAGSSLLLSGSTFRQTNVVKRNIIAKADRLAVILDGTLPTSSNYNPAHFYQLGADAPCFGPTLDYVNHPGGGNGTLPQGDLGIWTETVTGTGESCAAAHTTQRLRGVSRQTGIALRTVAAMASVYQLAGFSWPGDMVPGTGVALTAGMNLLGIPNTVFTLATMSLNLAGDEWTHQVHLLFDPDGALPGAAQKIQLRMVHKVLGTGEYEGVISYIANTENPVGGNCTAHADFPNATRNVSLHYQKHSSTDVRVQSRSAQACGHDVDLRTTPASSTHLAGERVVNLDPTGWADDANVFTGNYDVTNAHGNFAHSWQAGHKDSHSRNLNYAVATDVAGETYYGYGDRIDLTDGSIRGFICNWAGPGNSHTLLDYAQRQHITRNTTTGIYEPSNAAASDITYAPTNDCLHAGTSVDPLDPASHFIYDRDLSNVLTDETAADVNVALVGSTTALAFDLMEIFPPSHATPTTDLNGDGKVDITDAILQRAPNNPPMGPVP